MTRDRLVRGGMTSFETTFSDKESAMAAREIKPGRKRERPKGPPNEDADDGLCKQHHAAVRRQAPAVEPSGELLGPDGWKPERQSRIVGHGGCGRLDRWT